MFQNIPKIFLNILSWNRNIIFGILSLHQQVATSYNQSYKFKNLKFKKMKKLSKVFVFVFAFVIFVSSQSKAQENTTTPNTQLVDDGGVGAGEDGGGDVQGQPAIAVYDKRKKKWKIKCGELPGVCYTVSGKMTLLKSIMKVYVNGDKNPPVEIEVMEIEAIENK